MSTVKTYFGFDDLRAEFKVDYKRISWLFQNRLI